MVRCMCAVSLAVELEKEEFIELVVAALGLSLVYAYPSLYSFPIALVTIAAAFVPHELAHRYLAEHLGFRSRFRLSTPSLVSSIMICLLSGGLVKVGTAGAVEVQGFASEDDMGEIALAGPLTNMLIAALSALFSPASPLFAIIAIVSAGMGVFNLLPVPPLDGHYVARWNRQNWALVFGLSLLVSVLVSWSVVQDALGWLLWSWRGF